jgi:2-polyprenyl-3-methyl-5-hydroxy-6-metoxy-1,4-benzoquinol methylase
MTPPILAPARHPSLQYPSSQKSRTRQPTLNSNTTPPAWLSPATKGIIVNCSLSPLLKKKTMRPGAQINGSSPSYIKRMACEAIRDATGAMSLGVIADVGGGAGELARLLCPTTEKLLLLDFSPPERADLPANAEPYHVDLNETWPLGNDSVDFALSTEVIEHVENPRHFFREIYRITRPGGHIFITTPNNHSIASIITFVLRGEHRFFQDQSYPAHLTPLLRCDFCRMASENGLSIKKWYYSNTDTIPRLHWRFFLRGRLYSDVVGVLLHKK